MSDEEKLAAIRRREEQEKATQADLEQMDAVLSGAISESSILDNSADIGAPVVDDEPIIQDDSTVPDATGDEIVAEGEPDPNAQVEPAQVVEPEDGYDFSDFINSMARDALGKQVAVQPAPVQQVVPVQVQAPTPPQQVTLEVPQDLLSIDEMNEAFQDPAKMIALFGKVYIRAASDGAQAALIRLPNAVGPVIAQRNEQAEMVRTFFTKNPELANYRDFVQYCAVKVETEHPEYSPIQVLEETAKVAVARLPMVKEAVSRQKRAPAKPSFIGAQNQRGKNTPAAAKMSALDRELAEMPDKF